MRGIRWRLGMTFMGLIAFTLTVVTLTYWWAPRQDVLVISLLLALLLSSWIGIQVAARIAQPIEEMTEVARNIAAGDHSQRLFMLGDDEIGQLGAALDHMALTLKSNVDDISAERLRLVTILQNMPSGLLLVDQEGRVTVANPSAKRLLGMEDNVMGRGHVAAVKHYQLSQAIDQSLASGQPTRLELLVHHHEERWVDVRLSPLFQSDGSLGGVVIVLYDVTEAKRLAQIRRDFVANVSHELRTPVTSIKGFAETLLDGVLNQPEHAREFVEIIDREAGRLQDLVQDLLELAKIEAVEGRHHWEHFDWREVIDRSVSPFRRLADERGISLSWHAEGDAEVLSENAFVYEGDTQKIEQLVANLVENAINATPAGGNVDVRFERTEAGFRLIVSDTGVGIPRTDIPRIFERFYRVQKGRSRDRGGTGLGLAIVRHIAEAHRADIQVRSELGKGTTFSLTFPRTQSNDSSL